MGKRWILVTGATSGLGLAITRRLVCEEGVRLILPVRNAAREASLSAALTGDAARNAMYPKMDFSDLDGMRAGTEELVRNLGAERIEAVMLNAGLGAGPRHLKTAEGNDLLFTVNHLAGHILLRGIEPLLSDDAVVGWTSSGTHEAGNGKQFGFRGAQWLEPERLLHGDYDAPNDSAQCARDAYSTSKGCNMLSARFFARNEKARRRYFSYEPGFMPGTGLTREYSFLLRMAFRLVTPLFRLLMDNTSTPARSSELPADLLRRRCEKPSGAYLYFDERDVAPNLPANELEYAARLIGFSDTFCAPPR